MLVYLQMIETPEDQSKFEVVYEHYRGLMYHVAYEILKHEQDAEDAVHEAFLKVAENMKKLDVPISDRTKAFLVTIVENKAIDKYRAKAAHPEVPFNDETIGINVEYVGSNVLAACLLKLPSRYREVLTLKYHQGLDNREIAKAMDVSYDTVRKLEQRARDRLRCLCEKEELL